MRARVFLGRVALVVVAAGAARGDESVGGLLAHLTVCENVTIESVESRGFSCLTVESEAVASMTTTGRGSLVCEDTPGWSDGTNGCEAYRLEELDGSGW